MTMKTSVKDYLVLNVGIRQLSRRLQPPATPRSRRDPQYYNYGIHRRFCTEPYKTVCIEQSLR